MIRTFEIQTFQRTYDITAESREEALEQHAEGEYGGEVVIDSKDKTAKRAHERERERVTVPDGAHRAGAKLYKIKRFYRDDEQRNGEVIERGLTLEQAQAHCQDESTHAYNDVGEVVWFDGYDEE